MFKCGFAYPRCRWILPLLLILTLIFDIIALTGSGWVMSSGKHFASLWKHCDEFNGSQQCESLMNYGWGQAATAMILIGFILLIICVLLSFKMCCTPSMSFLKLIGFILFVAVLFHFIGLIIYPVKFTDKLINEGHYEYSWSYGFAWGCTILMFGCGIFFCCLSNYEDELTGNAKPSYLYTSS
ncbi:p53 apoptosis effector related to PMP-22-like [Latimeria chalumnae]|uniref:P53 apoptosis effector related to pmp22 n=1 Tax=Latimeria chalumnae TaxID=7897 RepID=H3B177_LATCH|nr:PREDICTED: p53 apoptosis effector related to PMP-22-like [Latimeria chalumnae]|eukprot:XP_006000524.1 PREDICTED: p53 apoptosis effector related to PMP-22-like [Latimeria chalumnae]